MTRTTSARLASSTYLLYRALGIPAMALIDRATIGEGIAARLASIAQHQTEVRVATALPQYGFSYVPGVK